jgi:hypothetical protein
VTLAGMLLRIIAKDRLVDAILDSPPPRKLPPPK